MKTANKTTYTLFRLTETHNAIYEALRRNETFAAFLLPGEPLSRLRFIADIEGFHPKSDLTFSINTWNTESSDRIIIRDTISAKDYLKLVNTKPVSEADPDIKPYTQSTNELLYKGQVLSVVTDLKEKFPSKTVLSRIVCGKLESKDTANTWLHVAYNYFKEFRNTLRFIYYTPQTGGWIGASPEILLCADKTTGNAETVALAGTKDSITRGWDEKNINEHELVVSFIAQMLTSMNIKFEAEEVSDVQFGHIKHKCKHFAMNLGEQAPYDVIDRISPTPALSGYPRPEALEHIGRFEIHDRRCYGGYVAIEDNRSLKAYVNLRCANFYKETYCIYTGSGLTEDSKADKEWRETDEKIAVLSACIKSYDYMLNQQSCNNQL